MNTELIKERNELAKQLCIHNEMSSESCLNEASKMMSLLYGDSWNKEDEHDNVTDCQPDTNPIVSIAVKNGEKGVRLCVGDVDIFIEAHNLDNGEEFEWKKAMHRLKEVGKRTFNKHEGTLIAAYIDEINAALSDIGGEELYGVFWSSTEYTSTVAWSIDSSGYIFSGGKCYSFTVRPCAAFVKA